MILWSGRQNEETGKSVQKFLSQKHSFTCWEHYVYLDLKTLHCCSWMEYFSIRQCAVSIHEQCMWLLKCYIFQPKDLVAWSGGMPIQSLDFFFWTHLKVCSLHHVTKNCEGIAKQHRAWMWQITEHKLWYVQAAVTSHVIRCHKLGGPTILKMLR